MNKKIIMYGTAWCPDCFRSKAVFDSMKVDFELILIDDNPQAAELVQKINNGYRSVPTIVFPNGKTLVEPRSDELIAELKNLL